MESGRVRYTNKLLFRRLVYPIIGVGFIAVGTFSLYVLYDFIDLKTTLLLIPFFFLGFHPIALFLNYYGYGYRKTIEFDLENGFIHITNDRSRKSLSISDIERIDIHECSSIGNYQPDFWYCKYFFGSKESVVVTSLMADWFYVPITVRPEVADELFPFINEDPDISIPWKSNDNPLYKEYEKLKSVELETIINSKGYRNSAKTVAKHVLQVRNEVGFDESSDISPWSQYEGGSTIGQVGSEQGKILRDEFFSGARVTLEQGGDVAPYSITLGIVGLFFHTHFVSTYTESIKDYDWFKSKLEEILAIQNDTRKQNDLLIEITRFKQTVISLSSYENTDQSGIDHRY